MASPKDFFYIRDLDALREKLARAERDRTVMGAAWRALRHRARQAPDDHPWFVPFVALVTNDPQDISAAKRQVESYLATFNGHEFGMGLHFHFWCFSFPHARWGLYFKWLDLIGAWTDAERDRIREELATWQLMNFFSGMRMKTEPECVDNQSLSLCYSNALFGRLFGADPAVGALARRMSRDGLRRLPDMLGGFPPSGYSGEGSTYMDGVVGPSIPFVVELLEAEKGGDWFSQPLPPNGGSAANVLRMVAREWMPNGLFLPWDHYGYWYPVRSTIAYGAYKTGEPLYFDLLEKAANWSYEGGIGWGFDDIVWALIWWPGDRPASTGKLFTSWAEKEVGGTLVSDTGDLYLMQMWDHGTPKVPMREHVNPNSVILTAFGSPLTIDGVADKSLCHHFDYADTSVERENMGFSLVHVNFGVGCAGSHNVLLVDGWEGMRPDRHYPQAHLLEFDEAGNVLAADVTPVYREKWPDTKCVRRRSRLCEQRFWLIEDLAAFGGEHRVTSRWFFRPEVTALSNGIVVETAEGVRLRLLPLLGPGTAEIQTVEGYPDRLDYESRQVDFNQQERTNRWLWLAFPLETRVKQEDVTGDWLAAGDAQGDWTYESALAALDQQGLKASMEMPPFMTSDAPVIGTWWYRRKITVPGGSKAWLRLPRSLFEPRLWIDGREIDLRPRWKLAALMPLDIELPAGAGSVEIVLRTEANVQQYSKRNVTSFEGRATVLTAAVPMEISGSYENGIVRVSCGSETWSVPHELMPVEENK